MLKLPSPSVVCAQNSPVILTTGFTRRRSTSMRGRARPAQRGDRVALSARPQSCVAVMPSHVLVTVATPTRGAAPARSPGAATWPRGRTGARIRGACQPTPRGVGLVPRAGRLEGPDRRSRSRGATSRQVNAFSAPRPEVQRRARSPARPVLAFDAVVLLRTAARGSRRIRRCAAPRRYSASYMPKRQGPQPPAVKNT